MKCELGKTEKVEVTLDNPLKSDIVAIHKCSNSQNFEVIGAEKLIIPGNGHLRVEIKYIPSDLENTESAIVTFETEEIGSWNFMLFGLGIPPTKFPVKKLSGSLGKDCTGTINFKNPFKQAISVS